MVRRFLNSYLPAACLGLGLLSGCSGGEPVSRARVGTIAIPDAQLAALAEAERQTLADLVGFGASVAAGTTASLIGPLIEREVDEALVSALPYQLGAERMGVGEPELRAAYAQDPEWELVVRHLVRLAGPGTPRARRDSAQNVAAEVAARAARGEDFARLAGEFSEEPGAAGRGGLLQPGREGSWVPAFWDAALRLAPGQVSDVVQTDYGYHVLQVEERRTVPFEEANRTRLLQTVVPRQVATLAMEEWVSRSGGILLDPIAIRVARDAIEQGRAIPDTLTIASGMAGGVYLGADLEAGWARLSPEERVSLEAADEYDFAAWVETDAREAIWADFAADRGLKASLETVPNALASWNGRIARWEAAFGFRRGMSDEEILQAAYQATRSGIPEARAQRPELRSLRPRLRRIYPLVTPEA